MGRSENVVHWWVDLVPNFRTECGRKFKLGVQMGTHDMRCPRCLVSSVRRDAVAAIFITQLCSKLSLAKKQKSKCFNFK